MMDAVNDDIAYTLIYATDRETGQPTDRARLVFAALRESARHIPIRVCRIMPDGRYVDVDMGDNTYSWAVVRRGEGYGTVEIIPAHAGEAGHGNID